jgi:hypothetical protein
VKIVGWREGAGANGSSYSFPFFREDEGERSSWKTLRAVHVTATWLLCLHVKLRQFWSYPFIHLKRYNGFCGEQQLAATGSTGLQGKTEAPHF